MAKPIRVIQWGVGAMGSGITRLLLTKPGVEIVGAISHQEGQDLGEAANVGRRLGVTIRQDPDAVLGSVEADVLLLSTFSFTKKVFPQIMKAVERKLNVITTAEEMLYPHVVHPDLAREIDQAARAHGVSVLGTGINPGFVLDTLLLFLTAPCHDVQRVWAKRVNDLAPFGVNVMREQGVGITPAQFEQGLADGTVVGHVGFQESITMIADVLGWQLDEIREERYPVVSAVVRQTPFIRVEPGQTAGSVQIGHGMKDGVAVITLEHPQQVCPEAEGGSTGDYVRIEGTPSINLQIEPEIAGGLGTIAMLVNLIPQVLAAKAGLVTMRDVALPTFFAGNR